MSGCTILAQTNRKASRTFASGLSNETCGTYHWNDVVGVPKLPLRRTSRGSFGRHLRPVVRQLAVTANRAKAERQPRTFSVRERVNHPCTNRSTS